MTSVLRPTRATRNPRPDRKIRKHCIALGAVINGHADALDAFYAQYLAAMTSLRYRLPWLLRGTYE